MECNGKEVARDGEFLKASFVTGGRWCKNQQKDVVWCESILCGGKINEGKERGADSLTATSFDSQMSNQFGKRVIKSNFLIMKYGKYCNQRLRNAIKLFN